MIYITTWLLFVVLCLSVSNPWCFVYESSLDDEIKKLRQKYGWALCIGACVVHLDCVWFASLDRLLVYYCYSSLLLLTTYGCVGGICSISFFILMKLLFQDGVKVFMLRLLLVVRRARHVIIFLAEPQGGQYFSHSLLPSHHDISIYPLLFTVCPSICPKSPLYLHYVLSFPSPAAPLSHLVP